MPRDPEPVVPMEKQVLEIEPQYQGAELGSLELVPQLAHRSNTASRGQPRHVGAGRMESPSGWPMGGCPTKGIRSHNEGSAVTQSGIRVG